MRARLPVLALLALLALGGVAAGTAQAPVGDQRAPQPAMGEETARVLLLEGTDRTALTRSRTNLSAAMSLGRERAAGRLTRYTVQEAFSRRDDENRTVARVERRIDALEADLEALRAREAGARGAYVAGDISTQAYVERLAVGTVRAESLDARIDLLRDELERLDGQYRPLFDRLADLDALVAPFHGPVRDQLAAAAAGDGVPPLVSVQATGSGLALSVVRGDTHVREVYRASNHDASSDPLALTSLRAQDLSRELYPWAMNNTNGFAEQHGDDKIHLFDIAYGHGTLETYVDWTRRQVYYERQERFLDNHPRTTATRSYDGSLQLVVSPTYPGGPLHVEVLDSSVPVPAAVTVANRSVGVGQDGLAWALAPASAYEVSARYQGRETTIVIRPETAPAGS